LRLRTTILRSEKPEVRDRRSEVGKIRGQRAWVEVRCQEQIDTIFRAWFDPDFDFAHITRMLFRAEIFDIKNDPIAVGLLDAVRVMMIPKYLPDLKSGRSFKI
jgi:hypothetical protein